jgi:hypothetical protein
VTLEHPRPTVDATAIRHLYRELHERDPGLDEIGDWEVQIGQGLTLLDVRRAILESDEYRERQKVRADREALCATGLFDGAWYLRRYPDVAAAGQDPVMHYIMHGFREDRAPNLYFDPASYRLVASLSVADNPLLHYAQMGEAAGLPPGPHFDPLWYRVAYRPEGSPLGDFLRRRFHRTVAPCARLWSVLGADAPAEPGTDPFEGFITAALHASATLDHHLLRASGLFESNFYALHSADVLEAGVDPLDHYCKFGWREGRQPSFYFNAAWYLATNPEAASLGVNPLLHYLLVGEPAGRRPTVFFDPAWYRDTYEIQPFRSPLSHYLANRRTQRFSPHPLFDPTWYMAQQGIRVPARRDPFTHFLITGMVRDVPPSPRFDPAAWRRRTRGRPTRRFRNLLSPEKDNPMVTFLLATYR